MSQRELIIAGKKISVSRLVLRERRPPTPEVSVKVRPHHMRWEVGRYRERIRSGPGGLGRGRVWTPERVGEQHNLVLDTIWDEIANHGFRYVIYAAAVGTGSTAPAATDTTLAAELVRTTNLTTGTGIDIARISDGTYTVTRSFEFTPAQVGGHNLTEWGMAPSTTGNLVIRELFRDGSGTPITLSLATDQGLRLIHAIQVSLSPVAQQAVSIDIANIGTVTGKMALVNGTGYYDFYLIDKLVSAAYGSAFVAYLKAITYPGYSGGYPNPSGDFTAAINPTDGQLPRYFYAYTPGSRKRDIYISLDTNEANGTIYAIGFSTGTGTNAYAALIFDAGSEIAKDDLHKLILDPWTITW